MIPRPLERLFICRDFTTDGAEIDLAKLHTALAHEAVRLLSHGFMWRRWHIQPAYNDLLTDADELVSIGMLAWFEKGREFRSEGGFRAWIAYAMRLELVNRWRRQYPEPLEIEHLSLDAEWARLRT